MLLSAVSVNSCKNPEIEVTTVDFTRVLTPTGLKGEATAAGDVLKLDWNHAKGATGFELEVYADPELAGECQKFNVAVDELPLLVKLLPDMTYYYRVRGVDAEGKLQPSNWAVFTDSKTGENKGIKTYAIKSSVDPEVVERMTDAISLKWYLPYGDTEITHILVTPAKGEEFEFPVTAPGEGITVTGLEPSTQYTLSVHYRSADRGSVVAWTRPLMDGSFTTVADTAAFKQALKDGATKIIVNNTEEPYVMGEMKVTGDFVLLGESSSAGEKPQVSGRFTSQAGLTSLHVEDVAFSGAEVPANDKGEGAMAICTHLFTVSAAAEFSKIEFVNVDASGYQRGMYYDNTGGKVTGQILFEGFRFDDCLGSGGDNIDIRKAGEVAKLILRNSTFNEGTRTFMRVDANQTFGEITVENCTFNNMCYNGTSLVIGGSNVQGIFAVKSAPAKFVVRKNLFLNNNCWLVGGNTACVVPAFSKNYVYNCVDQFFTSAKLDDSAARADMSEEVVLAENGVKLVKDPCENSSDLIFNVTEASVIKNSIGDTRWFVPYVEEPEDLTLNVTTAVKTWNFADAKIFKKPADKDMVRDGIRFYVQYDNPIYFVDGGINISGAAVVKGDGTPSANAMSIKVKEAGSLIITTENIADVPASIIFAVESKSVAAAAAGEQLKQVIFPDIVSGEETLIHILPTAPVRITALQWNAETAPVVNTKLETPAPEASAKSVKQGEEVTVSWKAIENAASYKVQVDDAAAIEVKETEYVVKTAGLAADQEHNVLVTALPAKDDMLRKSSDAGVVSFTVTPKPQPTPGGVAGKIVFNDHVGTVPATIEDGSIKLTINNGAAKMAIDENKAYFGTAAEQVGFTTRLKTGGKSGSNSGMTITIAEGASGTLKVYARTGSNSATDRSIVITGSTELINHVLLESEAITNVTVPGEADPQKVYPVLSADVTAGDYTVTYPVNGINIYGFEFVPAGAPGPAPVSKSWVFASEDWQTELAKMGDPGKDITGTWNITIDGLNYSASKSRWTNKCIQVTQDGRADGNGVFTFTAPAAGTVTVSASGTGSKPEGDRNVVIKTDGASEQVSINCNVSSNGDPATATFTVAAGEQKLYVTGALRIYSVSYDPAK